MAEGSTIIEFLGRFHPLVVHLPIGFLTLAILLEIISRRSVDTPYNDVLRFVWLVSGFAASVAVVLGFFLSLEGGYDDATLLIHQWSGITLAVMSFVCYLLRKDNLYIKENVKRIYFPLVLLSSALLIVTGHMGGSLTHGNEYLVEYAPEPIQRIFGMTPVEMEIRPKINSLDSADIFKDGIAPIFNSKCITCHNDRKRKGELVLTSYSDVMKGGENGPVITPGSLVASEMYRRITLPRDHKEFMPSQGKKPLTDEQLAIIEWWIEKKAPGSGTISSLDPDAEMNGLLENYFGLQAGGESMPNVLPADTMIVGKLVRSGFTIRRLAATGNQLEARFSGNIPDTAMIRPLLGIKDQLVWLQLTDTGISDEVLKIVGQLNNLRKLNISKNPVSNQGVNYLLGLTNLEYLNLFDTRITDSALVGLMAMPKLEELYLWKTNVSAKYVEELKKNKPGLKIVYEAR